MKKFIVACVLAAGIGAIAYASMSKNNSKQVIEKKTEKKEKKKECKRSCMYS